MSAAPDVIVIGAGVNGLVAGALLARRRLATLVLDRRPEPGGAAITTELAPGFHVPALSHALGPLNRDVVRALRLDHARLEFLTPEPTLTTLGANGEAIVFHRDPVLTAASIDRVAPADAARWRGFVDQALRLAGVVAEIRRQPPPATDRLRARDVWRLLRAGRRARALDRRERAQLVRWTTMPVADLASEWFESDLVRGVIGARAVFGAFAGPRSPGTGAMFLGRLADDPMPAGSGATVKGGPGALSRALAAAAERAGARVRTGARVVRILTDRTGAAGVELEDGETIASRAVVSAVDPRQTFLELVEPDALPPSFTDRIRHYRARGVTVKINVALSGAPGIPAIAGDALPLGGRLLVAPGIDYLERAFDAAKYDRLPADPWLELALPSVVDPSLAPEGGHVMSMYVHAVPMAPPGSNLETRREAVWRAVARVLAPIVPDLERLVVERQVILPDDLQAGWGLSGGSIFHGEPTIDQSWIARPLLGWARYATPVAGLFLAGAGTHPGGGLTGLSGLVAARTIARAVRR